mgnify:FL=1
MGEPNRTESMKKNNVLYQTGLFVCGLCLFLIFPVHARYRDSSGWSLIDSRCGYWEQLSTDFKIGVILLAAAVALTFVGVLLEGKKSGPVLRTLAMLLPQWMVIDTVDWAGRYPSWSLCLAGIVLAAGAVWGIADLYNLYQFRKLATRSGRCARWFGRMHPALVRLFWGLTGLALYVYLFILAPAFFYGSTKDIIYQGGAWLGFALVLLIVFVFLPPVGKLPGTARLMKPLGLYLSAPLSFFLTYSLNDDFWTIVSCACSLAAAVAAFYALCRGPEAARTKKAGIVYTVGALTFVGIFLAAPIAFAMLMPELTAHGAEASGKE